MYHLFDKEPNIDKCGLLVDQSLLMADLPRGKDAKKIVIKKDEMQLVYRTSQEIDALKTDDQPIHGHSFGNVEVEVQGIPRQASE